MQTTEQYPAPLFRFWERNMAARENRQTDMPGPQEWNEQVSLLSQYGAGMEEALKYVYAEAPPFDAFWQWVQQQRISDVQAADTGDVFTPAELEAWEQNGYIVLRDAVPAAQCAAACDAIWEFLQADIQEPASWYRHHPAQNGLMLRFSRHPALDANRRLARIKRAFEQLYRDMEIYLYIDKVSFNPPETSTYHFMGSPLHWDVSLQLPIPYALQGLLYLTDTSEKDGAFHCVPGFHNNIGEWMTGLPEGVNPRDAALNQLQPVPIAGNAGDMVIWHQALPHCATANKGKLPRMVQYITYLPIKSTAHSVWR